VIVSAAQKLKQRRGARLPANAPAPATLHHAWRQQECGSKAGGHSMGAAAAAAAAATASAATTAGACMRLLTWKHSIPPGVQAEPASKQRILRHQGGSGGTAVAASGGSRAGRWAVSRHQRQQGWHCYSCTPSAGQRALMGMGLNCQRPQHSRLQWASLNGGAGSPPVPCSCHTFHIQSAFQEGGSIQSVRQLQPGQAVA